MYIGFLVKYQSFLSNFNETSNFLTDFLKKKTQIPNFIKIRTVGVKFFYADRQTGGRTEIMKLGVALSTLLNAPNKVRGQKLYIFLLLAQKLIVYILKAPCVREKTGKVKRTDHYYTSCSTALHDVINLMCYSRPSIVTPAPSA
jgi:hypothetical protein